MNYIYGYQNKTNNKWYVGQTTLSIKERHRLHINSSKNSTDCEYNSLFHRKLREYGVDNFDLVILEEVSKKENLDEREIFWIAEKHSFVRDNGYNLTIGRQKRKDNENYVDIRAAFQTTEEVQQVIQEIKDLNNNLTDLANKYKVSLSLICMINTGRKYFQDSETYPLRPLKTKISQDLVLNIITLLKESYSNDEIAKIFQIDNDVVYRINYGKAHKQPNETYPIRKELSKNEIRANKIKELLKENKLNNKEIAQLVGCDPSVVSNINYGKNYFDKNLNYPLRKS